jgi:hypothetical protein
MECLHCIQRHTEATERHGHFHDEGSSALVVARGDLAFAPGQMASGSKVRKNLHWERGVSSHLEIPGTTHLHLNYSCMQKKRLSLYFLSAFVLRVLFVRSAAALF